MPKTENNFEMIAIANTIAKEKNIEPEIVYDTLQQALIRAAQARYGMANDYHVAIDQSSGTIKLERVREVVDVVEDPATQIALEDARAVQMGLQVGDYLTDALPSFDFGRITAQAVRQVINQRIRAAERQKQYEEYKDKVGDIVTAVVKRDDYGALTVDLGHAEGLLRRDQTIPQEHYNIGDRLKCLITEVREESKGSQIFLSRAAPEFMAKLFEQEVPEIYEGAIKIASVARDPGSRGKIAVYSNDASVDPVGACVGIRGSRVQAVINELSGEKIDVIKCSQDLAVFVVDALAPAEVSKIIIDESESKVEVVVAEEMFPKAIGRRGQNVRLASQLTNVHIDVCTETEDRERRRRVIEKYSKIFVDALDVDEVIAQLLTSEGYTSVESIARAESRDLQSIEGFDTDIAAELQTRAMSFVEAKEQEILQRLEAREVDQALIDFLLEQNYSYHLLDWLSEREVTKLDVFADLSTDELLDAETGILIGYEEPDEKHAQSINATTLGKTIIAAREQLNWIPPQLEVASPEADTQT